MEDKLKKNIKKSKQIFQSQKVSGEELWSGPPWEALRHLAMHLQQLRRASAPGRGPDRGSWCRAGGAAAGRGPRAGHGCFFQGPTSGWLAGAHPRSLPPFLPPPSLPDPLRGGAIVTDTIPVLKPLHFINETSSTARARSLLNIYESFLQGGNYCKLQFPFAKYPPDEPPTPVNLLV